MTPVGVVMTMRGRERVKNVPRYGFKHKVMLYYYAGVPLKP